MHMCIYSIFCIPCIHHFCLCITPYIGQVTYAHLHVHCYHITPSMYNRHHQITLYEDPMITGQVVMVLKVDLFIYLHCFHVYFFLLFIYPYYMVALVQPHVLVLVLLLYILLPPSFYHSLGRFLTTLGLHAQIGDPSDRVSRQRLGFTQETHHRDPLQVSLSFVPVIIFIPVFLPIMITYLFLQVFLY